MPLWLQSRGPWDGGGHGAFRKLALWKTEGREERREEEKGRREKGGKRREGKKEERGVGI